MSLALANASKSNYFPFNDYFNIIFSKKGITEEDLSARPGWLVVFRETQESSLVLRQRRFSLASLLLDKGLNQILFRFCELAKCTKAH